MKAVSEKDIIIGSYSLETLTTGMYEDPRHCLREYIQNSYDSIRSARSNGLIGEREGIVSVAISGSATRPTLTITDDGEGITMDSAVPTLVSVGASRKRSNLNAGFRGIGRLAGVAYCTTLRFTTTAKGEDVETVVEFDCALMRSYMRPAAEVQNVEDVIRLCAKSETRGAPVDEHRMQVEMVGLVGVGIEFVEIEELVPYLRQVSPTDYSDRFSFADRIRAFCASIGDPVGTVEVETRFKRERRQILKGYDDAIPAGGKTSKVYDIELLSSPDLGWHAWIGHSTFEGELTDNTVAGIRFRVKNIQVGSSDIIEDLAAGLTAGRTERRLQRWAVGEIFITNPAVVPNARRDGFEDSKEWRKIKEDVRLRVAKRVVTLVRNASKSRSTLKTILQEVATLQRRVEARPADEAAVNALISTTERLLSRFASYKLSGVDPKEVGEAVVKVKSIREVLEYTQGKLRKQQNEQKAGIAADDEPDVADGGVTEKKGASGRDEVEGDYETEREEEWSAEQILEALLFVVANEHGQAEADRLFGLARDSLAGD